MTDETKKETAPRVVSKRVGTVLTVAPGVTVVRPDLTEITVAGKAYVLDVPGVHVVDGKSVTAK